MIGALEKKERCAGLLHPIEDLLRSVDQESLAALVRKRAASARVKEPPWNDLLQAIEAQSILWMHFLQDAEQGKYRALFMKYLDTELTARGGLEPFKAAFAGVDLATLNREFFAFVLDERERLHPTQKLDRAVLEHLFDDRADKDDADKGDDDHMPGMGDTHDLPGMPGMRGLMGPNGGMAFMLGRGRLGVELGEDSDNGALVTRVLDGTPADRAGLKAGDVITEFDGHKVDGSDDLRRMVREHEAGDVDVRVERRGQERTLTAHLPEREDMNWRALPGGNGWQGWMDHRDGTGTDKDKVKRRVYRYQIPNGGDMDREFQGLSPEDRAQLQKDLRQLREDLQRMRREMRERRQTGDDNDKARDKDDDDAHDRHHDSDDDDDSGN